MAIEPDPSTLNVVISILGFFILAYGAISVKIKNVWYLGEALPAVIFGALLGPMAARWLDARMWGMAIVSTAIKHNLLAMTMTRHSSG
jgi:sodium/hydrogen antiporter